MRAMTSRERRVLKLFIFVLAPLFAAAYGARPLIQAYRERSSLLDEQRELLARERQIVEDATWLAARIDSSRQAFGHESRGLIDGSERATAHAALANHLRAVARRNEVLVNRVTEMPADSIGDGLTLLRVALNAESDLAGVTRFLESVRTDSLQLRISRIFIESSSRNQIGGSAVASDGRYVLSVNATVEALARLRGPSPASGQ